MSKNSHFKKSNNTNNSSTWEEEFNRRINTLRGDMVRLTEEKKNEVINVIPLWIAATFDILNANKEPEDEKNKELFKTITPRLLKYNNDHNMIKAIQSWIATTFDILNANKEPVNENDKELFKTITPKLLKFNNGVTSKVKSRIKALANATQLRFDQLENNKLNVKEFTKHKREEEEKIKTMTDNSNKRMDEMEKNKVNVKEFTLQKIEQHQQFVDLGRRINTASGVVNGKIGGYQAPQDNRGQRQFSHSNNNNG
jgi:hypothetical protein